MKYFLLLVIFIGSFILSSCYRPSPKQAFADLRLLEGKWTSYEGILFNESWLVINDSLMRGIGFSLNGTDTAFSEQLVLKRIGDTVFYGALVEGNNGFIYFWLEKAGRGHWIFKNPDHDYPNIIEYKLKNDTLLETTTSNIRGNKKINFKLKKVSL